jgi:predicted transport protein
MSKSPEEMAQSMIDNLKEKTGKTLKAWLKVVGDQKLEKHGQIVSFLKKEHGVTHGYANLIAHKAREAAAGPSPQADPVDAQYSGPKAGLRPVYDKVVQAAKAFGKDVEIAPKKAYVSLRRNKQFALVQPSTRTRVDLGINLKGEKPTGRLEASGSFNAMVSHRVRLESLDDFDDEVQGWLRQAYEKA